MSKERPNRTLARRIAKALFTNGSGVKADHLALYRDGRPLGGWGLARCEEQIEKAIDRFDREEGQEAEA